MGMKEMKTEVNLKANISEKENEINWKRTYRGKMTMFLVVEDQEDPT